MPRILVLSVSAGAGHIRAAEALVTAAKQLNLGDASHLDVMTLVPKLFRTIYADKYIDIVNRHPALWGYLYHQADKARADSTLTTIRTAIERLNTRAFAKALEEHNPDIVICTHFLPAQLLSEMISKNLFNKPVWVTVTDFDVHSMWIHPHLTGYCAADGEIAARMAKRGLANTRREVTGIPIHPVFSQPLDRNTCAKELGLDPKRTTVLLMSGGLGMGALDSLAQQLLMIPSDMQIIALAGKNADLLKRLTDIAVDAPGRLFPQGFTNTIERMMAASDLAVTKPGGLTSSECLAMGLPMLVVSPIPGQEERNSDYLLENGAALKAHDLAGVEYRVRQLLQDPSRLQQLQRNARAIAKPHSAQTVLELALRSLNAN